MQNEIRFALETDLGSIQQMDEQLVGKLSQRSKMIADAIQKRNCKVILADSQVLGYSIWDPGSFREMDLLILLVVDPRYRRCGLASALITDFQNASQGGECWTSTNASNLSMRSLLKKLGWIDSGHAEELDPGDPDMYFLWRKEAI